MINDRQHQRFFIILVVLSGMLACSQSPVAVIKQSAGESALIDRVKVKRQREFVIPSLSHIGLLVMPVSINSQSDTQNSQLLSTLTKEGAYTFNHVFASVTVIDRLDTQRQPDIDFVIRASLVDAVSYSRDGSIDEQVINGKVQSKPEKKHSASRLMLSRIRPYHALIRVELLDARSKRSLDVAVIKARSGAFGSKQYSGLLRQSFAAYSKAITSTYSRVY
jgi:hypothetical protein